MISDKEEEKRQKVRLAYERYGFSSEKYTAQFDELHDLVMKTQAESYKAERGLPPNTNTPCDEEPRRPFCSECHGRIPGLGH